MRVYERAATIRKWFTHRYGRDFWSFHEHRNALLSIVKLLNRPCGSDFRSFHECRKALLLLAKLFSSQYDHSCDTIIENYINYDGGVNGPPQARIFLGFATQNSAKNNVFWRFSSTISKKNSAFGRNFGISRIKPPLCSRMCANKGGLIRGAGLIRGT